MNIVFGRVPVAWDRNLSAHGTVLNWPLASDMTIEDPLVLTDYGDISMAGKYPDRFPKRFCPTDDMVSVLAYPIRFNTWMGIVGLSDMIPRTSNGLAFPCVVKEERHSSGGEGVHLVVNKTHLIVLLADLKKRGVDRLMQEAVVGHIEYVAHQLVRHGTVLTSIVLSIRLRHQYEIKSGSRGGVRVELDLSPLDAVYRALNYTGFSAVNFKLVGGQMKVFEINPRMGASLVLNQDLLAEMMDEFRKVA